MIGSFTLMFMGPIPFKKKLEETLFWYCWWQKSRTTTVWMYQTLKNKGINYQPQLVNAGFQPSTESFPLCQPWLKLSKLPNDKKLCQSPPLTTPRLAGIEFITIRWKKSSLQKLKETHSLARLHMTTVFVFDCICICMYAFMFVCMCQYVSVCMTKHMTKVCLIHASWWRSRCIIWWTQWTIYTCPNTKGCVLKYTCPCI